jgi:hypothetical protein
LERWQKRPMVFHTPCNPFSCSGHSLPPCFQAGTSLKGHVFGPIPMLLSLAIQYAQLHILQTSSKTIVQTCFAGSECSVSIAVSVGPRVQTFPTPNKNSQSLSSRDTSEVMIMHSLLLDKRKLELFTRQRKVMTFHSASEHA